MATYLKNTTHFTPGDWSTNSFAISTNAERARDASMDVRQNARFLRNETDAKTKWDQHDNNVRLDDRIQDIRKWKEIMEETLGKLDKEIACLSNAKDLTEERLANLEVPLDVVRENLTTRDGRQSIDVVDDEANRQLRKELEIVEKCKKLLQERSLQQFEQICRLQEARQEVLRDIQNKNVALGIDVDQYNLNECSPNISYKPDPCRIDPGTLSLQNWEDFSRYNKDRADAEIASSTKLREETHHTLNKCDNDYEASRGLTGFALRKRLHETKRALGEDEWQKENLEAEMCRLENDIRGLEDSIASKIAPSKLAQTRAENRHMRPGPELCRDEAQIGLCEEIKQLDASTRALQDQLSAARQQLQNLENNLHRVNEDIAQKKRSMELDRRVVEGRERLAPGKQTAATTDDNLRLTGVQNGKFDSVLLC